MTNRLLLGLAAIVTATAASACDIRVNDKGVSLDVNEGGRAEDRWTRSYTLPKGGRFELEAAFGSIAVVAATGDTIDVVATRRVHARSDQAAVTRLNQLQMNEQVAPDRVFLKASVPEGRGGFRGVNVEYELKVPPGVHLVIKSEYGDVRLNDVQGRFDVAVTNGNLIGQSVSGGLNAQSVNGPVIMELVAITGDIRITTVNGNVFLGLPPGLNAIVDAKTINAGITVRSTLPMTTTTKEPQQLSGRLGTGKGPRIEIHATNGGVHLGGGKPPT